MTNRSSSSPSDSGSAGGLFLIGVLVILTFGLVIGIAVSVTRIHAETDAAADLTALAVAGALLSENDACETGRAIAKANGAFLRACTITGLSATVTVANPLPARLSLLAPSSDALSRATAELRGSLGDRLLR